MIVNPTAETEARPAVALASSNPYQFALFLRLLERVRPFRLGIRLRRQVLL